MAWEFEAPNPITGYGVGLEFAGFIQGERLSLISELHPQVKNELPRRVPQMGIVFPGFPTGFGLPVGSPGGPIPQPTISGVTFDRLLPDGATHSAMNVNPISMNYNVSKYSRWAEFWPLAERLISLVAKIAVQDAPIRAIRLQANNRFTAKGAPDLRDLLQPSALIPAHILEEAPPCHFSLGWQRAQFQLRLPGILVQNVMLTVNPTPEGAILADLNFNFRMSFETNLTDPAAFDLPVGGQQSVVAESFFSLHKTNNMLFNQLLLGTVLAQIPGMPLPC